MVLDIRDLWPDSLKGVGVFNHPPILWFFAKVEKLLYLKSDAIVVNSPIFADHVKNVANIRSEDIIFYLMQLGTKKLMRIFIKISNLGLYIQEISD